MAPKAKPLATPTIEDLFTTLNRHIQEGKHAKAVEVSDQILAVAPGDEDALKCKVVGLIKERQFDKALLAINAASRKFSIDFSYSKAYCLYKLNKLEEASDLLKDQESNPSIMLLKSQILFRMGKMDACADIYQKLQKSKIDSLEINAVAALVFAARVSEVQGMMEALRVKATSSFELAFNIACSLIDSNKYTDAEQLLLSARRIGQETLTEEAQDEEDVDIDSELAPIAVQLAHVQHLLGHTQEAINSYMDINKSNLNDASSLAVAKNNLVALKGPKDTANSLRKLDQLIEKHSESRSFQLADELDSKLSPKQREAIYINRLLLLLHANKMDQARELVAALPDLFPESLMPVLLQAAVLVRENKVAKAEELLGQFADKFPDKSKQVLLARAQVAAAAGHPQIAAESLGKIPNIQHMPATVATLVSLKERAGDIDGANAVFDSAMCWWSNAMIENNKLSIIMQEAASFKLKHGHREEAAHLYEQLIKSHGSIEALVGLIRTVACTDVEKAEAYERRLKPLPALKAVDVDTLEKTSGAKNIESNVRTTESYEAKTKEKAKKKRKRKPRYPKGFDPANPGPPPDPERWLPKKERSSYRPKRKDKRAAQIRGSQGAVVKEAANNSKSNQVTHSKGAPQNAGTEPSKPMSKPSKKKSRK